MRPWIEGSFDSEYGSKGQKDEDSSFRPRAIQNRCSFSVCLTVCKIIVLFMGCNHSKVSNEIVSGSDEKESSKGREFREIKVNLIILFFYNQKHLRRRILKRSRLLVHRAA